MEADEDLSKELNKYLTSFAVVEYMGNLTHDHKYLSLRRDQLIKDLDLVLTTAERCRTSNAISFLCFILEDIELASEYNNKVLELDVDNIIALANHAQFLYKEEKDFRTIQHICAKLSGICKDQYKTSIAKGEIAFTYTIFGPRFCKKARQLFHEVLTECNKLPADLKLSREYKENVCMWSLGYAITFTRLLNVVNIECESELDKTKYVSVCEICRDIIEMEGHSDICKLYTARAYVLLGEVSYHLKGKKIFPNNLKDILPEDRHLHMDTKEYYQKALTLGRDCVFVLERCGKYFRYTKEISKSIEVLELSINIKPTAQNHHHLALALQRQLELDSKSLSNNEHGASACAKKGSGVKQQHTKAAIDNESARYRRCIKCPSKVAHINTVGQEELLEKVVFYLDESFKINRNVDALYDKGLLFRRIGRINDALEIFRSLIRTKNGPPVKLTNAYEQAGLCLDDLLCRSLSENQTSDEEDMIMYFKKSIEIRCNIVAKIPALEQCWTSAPTLSGILNQKIKTKRVLKDLKFLYAKIHDYGSLLKVLDELKDLAENKDEEIRIYEDIIKTHKRMKHYDDAILASDIIKCLPKWQQLVNKELFITVHIEGAFDALKKDHNTVAGLRLRSAFDFCNRCTFEEEPKASPTEQENDEDEQYDICVLSDRRNTDYGIKLCDLLNLLGLRTTITTECVPPGKLKSQGIIDVIKRSKHFCVVQNDNMSSVNDHPSKELSHYFDMMKEITMERNHGNVVILVPDADQLSKLPEMFSGCRKMSFEYEDDTIIQESDRLKCLLTCLAIGTDESNYVCM